MKVEMLTFRAQIVDGMEFGQAPGEIVEIADQVEAGRMIRAGQAKAVNAKEGEAAVKASIEDGKPLGINRAS